MKILIITPVFLPHVGGAEIGIHEIYHRLGKRHDVVILTPKLDDYPPLEGFERPSYRVIRYSDFFNLGRIRGSRYLGGIIPPFSIGAWRATRQTIPKIRPDVVNVHYAAYTGLTAVYAQQIARIPTVLSLIGRDTTPGPDVPYFWPTYARLIASRVAHTIFISDYCASFYQQSNLASSVVPYGTDTTRLTIKPSDEALRQQLRLSADARVLFTMQRLNPIKRVDMAIRAVRHLVDAGVTNVVLLIGGTGPQERPLNQLVESLGIQSYIQFIGFIPENQIADYFSLADVFVFPSQLETFGIVLAQAMAAGVPVAATRNSAIPEVVDDGVTGLLSPPLDAQALAQNIARLLTDEALRSTMGIQARRKAERLYDWEQVAKQYEAVLQQAAEGK